MPVPTTPAVPPVQFPHSTLRTSPLALGGSVFGSGGWEGERADALLATMDAAVAANVRHFDTAADYGGGASERLIGRFLRERLPVRRDELFIASKAALDVMDAGLMLAQVDASRTRLQTDVIDLFYIHWPRQGRDMRPLMEGLERARAQGKVRAIGVSNFSVAQMEQVAEVGTIDAHQLGYNLFWRFAEAEVIPYCRRHGIAVVAYSAIAQGILTGKYPRDLVLPPGDQRAATVHFEPDVWPQVHAAVEELQALAAETGRPLAHLAIRWVLAQPGLTAAVVGARTPEQVAANAAALEGPVSEQVLARMTAVGDRVTACLPQTGNPYRYYP